MAARLPKNGSSELHRERRRNDRIRVVMLHGDRNVGLMLFRGRDCAVPKVIGERLTLSLSVFDRNPGS